MHAMFMKKLESLFVVWFCELERGCGKAADFAGEAFEGAAGGEDENAAGEF